jgi:hypothetical protein
MLHCSMYAWYMYHVHETSNSGVKVHDTAGLCCDLRSISYYAEEVHVPGKATSFTVLP